MEKTLNTRAIEIDRLSVSYDATKVLNDVSFTVEEGEYVSIIGPNGAGKSTLLKCINRIIKKESGSLRIFGKALEEYAQKELGRLIGYVTQNHDGIFPYTVLEFVMMGRYPYLNPLSRVSSQDLAVVEEALTLTNMMDFARRKVGELSGGERQKVYIAAALAQQPKILLLDEPTTHLDPKYQKEILQTIRDICGRLKLTVLHVTHDLNHISFWSEKILAIKNGTKFIEGRPVEILTDVHLKGIFDTDFVLMPHPLTKQTVILPKMT